MKRNHSNAAFRAANVVLLGLMIAVPSVTSAATDPAQDPLAVSAEAVSVQHGARLANNASFDWLTKKSATRSESRPQPAAAKRIRSGRSLGRGSYICTPAGFGKRASCRAR